MIDKQLEQVVNKCGNLNGKISWIDVQAEMEKLGESGSTEMWRSRWRRMHRPGKRRVKDLQGGVQEIERRKAAGENVQVWFQDGELWYETKPVQELGTMEFTHLAVRNEIKIALLGDTHIGSDKTAWEELMAFYEYAYNQGVRDFYHDGDMTDGMYKNRDNSFYEQDAIGFQQQLDMVIDKYPKIDGVTTYFITGKI